MAWYLNKRSRKGDCQKGDENTGYIDPDKTHLWFLEGGIDTWLEVSKITKHTLFEFFHVSDGSSEGLDMGEWGCREKKKDTDLESEDEGSDDICASDMIEAIPQDTTDVFLVWEQETVHAGRGRWMVWVVGGGGHGLIRGIETL